MEINEECIERIKNCLDELIEAVHDFEDTYMYEKSKRWINREYYRRPFYEEKNTKGFHVTTFPDLKLDEDLFYKIFRMDIQTFDYLLALTTPFFGIMKRRRDMALEEERLCIALRYISLGDDVISLAISHRIGESTIREHIKETCKVINKALESIYMCTPDRYAWRNIAKGFEECWQLPNCIGAIDGKHVGIEAPANTGAVYYNYKKYYSVVLLAACDHEYKFTCADVGAFGSESDGGILIRSKFGAGIENNTLDIPDDAPNLPRSSIQIPFYFVGDDAFRLTTKMIKPYSGNYLPDDKIICNYRISRGRRCIENAFGILAARFRVLNKRIGFQPETVNSIVMACVCLHNFLLARTESRNIYCPPNFLDQVNEDGELIHGEWRNEVVGNNGLNMYEGTEETLNNAEFMRDALRAYFMSPSGKVSWQSDFVNRGRHRDPD